LPQQDPAFPEDQVGQVGLEWEKEDNTSKILSEKRLAARDIVKSEDHEIL
jgi:hypothetical protein